MSEIKRVVVAAGLAFAHHTQELTSSIQGEF